jgi:transposase
VDSNALKQGLFQRKPTPKYRNSSLLKSSCLIWKNPRTVNVRFFFVDAAHLLWGPSLGYLWCRIRHFVLGAHGRNRFNILGAIEVHSQEFIQVDNDSYINRWSVVELLMQIAAQKYSVPVSIVLDNAPYQHALVVKWVAAYYDIELLYLPSYSPNLNLIERFWKLLRSKALINVEYESFESMKNGILSFVRNLTSYKEEISSLLSTNFQTFGGVKMLEST